MIIAECTQMGDCKARQGRRLVILFHTKRASDWWELAYTTITHEALSVLMGRKAKRFVEEWFHKKSVRGDKVLVIIPRRLL